MSLCPRWGKTRPRPAAARPRAPFPPCAPVPRHRRVLKAVLAIADGGSFSGSNATSTVVGGDTLWFRGKHVLKALQTDLLTNRGLEKATDVVISGCSAGGLATFLHVDDWAALPKLAAAKIRGMPDSGMLSPPPPPLACFSYRCVWRCSRRFSVLRKRLHIMLHIGFFLDAEQGPKYHSNMQWVFNYMNSTSGDFRGTRKTLWDYFTAFAWCFTAFACAVRLLKHGRFVSLSQGVNDACIAANGGGDEWKCIFAEHTSPHIKTPIFPLQVRGATI